jgi:hypothetical protein
MVRVTRDATGLWTLYSSTLPTGSGTGAVASDQPNSVNTATLQGSVVNNAFANMDNGYISFAALHSSGTTARAGAEFDQLQLSIVAKAPLPVRFGNVNAFQSADGNRLQWTNETETDMAFYAIEGSNDAMAFSMLGQLTAQKNAGGPAAYQYLDPVARPGTYYYRIKAVEISGKTVYSNIIRMVNGNGRPEIRVYPNPAIKSTELEAAALPPGVYSIKIFDQSGRLRFCTEWDHGGGSVSRSISLKGWEAGNYFVVISGPLTLKNRFVVQ